MATRPMTCSALRWGITSPRSMSATVEPGATRRQSVFRRQFDERILNGPLTDGSSMPTYCCSIGSHESRAAPKEGRMRKQREALLVAALAGLLIVGAAALVE